MSTHSTLHWAQFVQKCKLLSENLISIDALEQSLLTLFRRIQLDDSAFLSLCHKMEQHVPKPYRTELIIDNPSCKMMLVLLQSKAEIALHNHPKQSGFIYCLQGEVLVENFEELSSTADDAILQQVSSTMTTVGGHCFFTQERGNIHHLKAVQKTLLLDIFLPPLLDENRHLCRRYELKNKMPGENRYHARIIRL